MGFEDVVVELHDIVVRWSIAVKDGRLEFEFELLRKHSPIREEIAARIRMTAVIPFSKSLRCPRLMSAKKRESGKYALWKEPLSPAYRAGRTILT